MVSSVFAGISRQDACKAGVVITCNAGLVACNTATFGFNQDGCKNVYNDCSRDGNRVCDEILNLQKSNRELCSGNECFSKMMLEKSGELSKTPCISGESKCLDSRYYATCMSNNQWSFGTFKCGAPESTCIDSDEKIRRSMKCS